METLQSLDAALFRFINQGLSNPLFDWLMPLLSGHALFPLAVAALSIFLIWKFQWRGLLCVVFAVLVVALCDPLVINMLKKAIARPRPFVPLPESLTLIGRSGSFSMPSGHAANCFAVAMVAFLFFRRSWRFMFPFAAAVAFSRVYNGVHYPGDVFVGAVLGAGCAITLAWLCDAGWQWAGPRWFPLWHERFPSLLLGGPTRVRVATPEGSLPCAGNAGARNQHWLRLGYVIITALLFARLGYLASGTIELSEDEAYQWQWGKHPALAYFSKPPFVAYAQWIGATLWGDTAFGVRFLAPVITAVLSFLILRFLAREASARLGVCVVIAATASPLLSVGGVLLTVDCLSVLFWSAAMFTGWRAIQADSTRFWLWTGLWLGCGFLSKNTGVFQLVSFVLFFVASPVARAQLRRPGPWLAVSLHALAVVPQLIWNYQNGWPTVTHLIDRAGLNQQWQPRLNFLQDFVIAEFGLLNPIFVVAMIWAAVALWRRPTPVAGRSGERPGRSPLAVYFFCMGAPLFLGFFLYTLRARVQPNWIVPAVLPLLCLAALHWDARRLAGVRAVGRWFAAGAVFGFLIVALLHDTNLTSKLLGWPVPPSLDPLTRVRGWSELTKVVEVERQRFLAEGKPVFLIGAHYGITGLMSFYLPEARSGVPHAPLVYYQSAEKADNQFWFWPGYSGRKGENALYVQKVRSNSSNEPPPARLVAEFASVTGLGTREVQYRGQTIHYIRLFACRDLR